METLNLFYLCLLMLLITSCRFQTGAEKKLSTDSLALNQPVYSSPENFIKSFTDSRKSSNPTDYRIRAKLFFSKGDFYIINFIEETGNYSYTYSVVLNPAEKKELDDNQKSTYLDVQELLKSQTRLNYAVFIGNFKQTEDLTDDGSPDFILEEISGYRTDYYSTQTVVLYNGLNKLTLTSIGAVSAFESGNGEGFNGISETLEFKKDPQITVIVHRTEDSYGKKTINYDKTWRWSKLKAEWEKGFRCIDTNTSSNYVIFTEKLTKLSKKDDAYFIQENCATLVPDFFVLKRITTELSDFYKIETEKDLFKGEDTNNGHNTVFNIQRKDSFTYIILRGYEGGVHKPLLAGSPAISLDPDIKSDNIIVKKDPVHPDICFLIYSTDTSNTLPFTRSPENYKLVKCK